MEGADANKAPSTPVDPYARKNPQMQLSIQVLKEPRGMMRVLQFIFSIFAFSTTAGFWTNVKFVAGDCGSSPVSVSFDYPFSLSDKTMTLFGNEACKIDFIGDSASQAQFFVATGVLSFLFSIGIVGVYLLFDAMYQTNPLLPVADFAITTVLSIFWLAASSAWSQGVSDLKYFTNPDNFLKTIPSCLLPNRELDTEKCHSTYGGSFATVNVSLIFGFLNFALWAASLWFVFKETHWFKRRETTTLP